MLFFYNHPSVVPGSGRHAIYNANLTLDHYRQFLDCSKLCLPAVPGHIQYTDANAVLLVAVYEVLHIGKVRAAVKGVLGVPGIHPIWDLRQVGAVCHVCCITPLFQGWNNAVFICLEIKIAHFEICHRKVVSVMRQNTHFLLYGGFRGSVSASLILHLRRAGHYNHKNQKIMYAKTKSMSHVFRIKSDCNFSQR